MDKICRFLLIGLMWLPLQSIAEISDSRFLQPSPSSGWYTMETEHFRINFKLENQDYAERLSQIAERQHSKLVNTLSWQPSEKTEIVVNDNVDYSNGASTAYPYNQFYVYLNEPVDGTLKDHIDFTETLFTHEYTHILQMDQATGLPEKLRRIFGKSPNSLLVVFTMPQMLAPHWIKEGIAIYTESMSGFGRNHSAVFEAMMREEVATGLASLKDESYEGYYGSRWPFGQVYLYGAYFYQFLEQEYGQQAVLDFFDHYSDNLIPWKMNERARKTTGKSAEDLWQQFLAYLEQRFRADINVRSEKGLTEGSVLFDEHWQNTQITPGPNGSVYFYHQDQLHTPSIIQLMPDGSQKVVVQIKAVTNLDWSPLGGLLISKLGVCENSALYADLYQFDSNENQLKRLTHCARTPRAAWAADGESIYAVQTSGAYNSLVEVFLDGKIKQLHKMQLGESIGFPAVSPITNTVVAAVKRNGKGWNLESFDTKYKQWTAITSDPGIYSQPFFSNDGESVCFVSDITKTPELHCMLLATGKQNVKTLSRGYIHDAAMATDGVLWVSEYTGDGDVIRKLESEAKTYQLDVNELITNSKALELSNYSNSTDKQHNVKPYNALKTLRPRGWGPLFLADNDSSIFGVTVTGSDVLGFHNWAITPMIFNQNDESHVGGILGYGYNDRLSFQLSETWALGYNDENDDLLDTPTIEESTKNAQMVVHFPLNNIDWSMDFFAGAAIEKVDQQLIARAIAQDTDSRVAGVGVSYNNFSSFAHAITQSSGVEFQLQLESFDLLGGETDYSGLASILQSHGNLRVGRNQTISLAIDAGFAEKTGKPFVLGGSTAIVDSLSTVSRLGQRDFSLHGYAQQRALTGTRFARASLAWHMPIVTLYNGFSSVPLGFGKVASTIFAEVGDAWTDASDKKALASVGVELNTEFLIGYDTLLLPLSFGLATGLDNDLGENQFYLKVNVSF